MKPAPQKADSKGRDLTLARSRRNYGRYPGVLGVSNGSKFSGGRRVKGVEAVQFFVREKLPEDALPRPLPRFVYARYTDGTVDRSRRVPTDVIELRGLKACCGAGSRVARVGGRGTMTLMFRDKASTGNETWGLTCAHVVGDLTQTPPASPMVVGGTDDCLFVGEAVGCCTAPEGRLAFDIALVKLGDPLPDFPDCGVIGTTTPISRVAGREAISVLDALACAFGISGSGTVVVESLASTLQGVDVDGHEVTIDNLVGARGSAVAGDSGGLIYRGDEAVGILVARAEDDWIFFQPLAEALESLQQELGVTLTPFDGI